MATDTDSNSKDVVTAIVDGLKSCSKQIISPRDRLFGPAASLIESLIADRNKLQEYVRHDLPADYKADGGLFVDSGDYPIAYEAWFLACSQVSESIGAGVHDPQDEIPTPKASIDYLIAQLSNALFDGGLKDHPPLTVHNLEQLAAELIKLRAFKAWVHKYLDDHGVPHHPPGSHGADGCRIGDRMDWLMSQLNAAREVLIAAKAAIEAASEERYAELKKWEVESERWKSENDMCGFNFFQGMAAGANWCDIFYRRVTRSLTNELEATPKRTDDVRVATVARQQNRPE